MLISRSTEEEISLKTSSIISLYKFFQSGTFNTGSKHSLRLKLSSEAIFTAFSLFLKFGVLCSYLSTTKAGESVQAKIKLSGIVKPSSIYFLITSIFALLVRHSTVKEG